LGGVNTAFGMMCILQPMEEQMNQIDTILRWSIILFLPVGVGNWFFADEYTFLQIVAFLVVMRFLVFNKTYQK